MPSAGFEPETPATKRPHTYALDRAATEVGSIIIYIIRNYWLFGDRLLIRNFGTYGMTFTNMSYVTTVVMVTLINIMVAVSSYTFPLHFGG
jgi:hypothetical protein